ncbi:hypothetical protein BGZ72_004856 [Mortierella alpina]|nr:hypothetical protein BGZ72_004856 [Mortierella alpina]
MMFDKPSNIMASNITTSPSPTIPHRQHKKRPSSTFCMQAPECGDPFFNTHYLTSPFRSHDNHDTTSLEPSSKRRSIRRPWTNGEQESLYVAVERLKLFGRWHEVKERMNLDRTLAEIEEEYTRLYAEIPDTEDEECTDRTPEEQDPDHEDYSLSTPALTATSSATPSARSSQDNIASLFDRSKTLLQDHVAPALDRPPEGDDDDEVEDEDEEQHHPQYHQQTAFGARPPRMVRVWTLEQSENLKNLIEVYFPGAYRINWVWVAAQMGNAFTRKQCKNKWEIMRRRMGSEDEINLLKRGYQEFGPSWGQIQEKYLPERSRGGISIMWELLETREAEQAAAAAAATGPDGSAATGTSTATARGTYHKRHQSLSATTKASSRYSHSREPSKHSLSYCGTESKLERRGSATMDIDTIMGPSSQGEEASSGSTMTAAADRKLASFGPSHSQERSNKPPATLNASRHARHRSDATWNMTKKAPGLSRHARHGSDTLSWNPPSQELWTDRSHPMTWTEPLSRRLEDLVRQHFPHHQKVNWAKISSLMGSNPVVSRDQCKRRWYLISQQQQQQQKEQQQQQQQQQPQHTQHRPSEQASEMSMIVEADDTMDTEGQEDSTEAPLISGLGIYSGGVGVEGGRVSWGGGSLPP